MPSYDCCYLYDGHLFIDTTQEAFESREKELCTQEADIRDHRVRFECERLIAFYEELANEEVSAQTLRGFC
jgi:hypothetical protein